MLRMLMRFFVNNEQLIERLSQSPVMRRAAEITVYTVLRWRQLGQKGLEDVMKSQTTNNIEQNSQDITSRFYSLSKRLSDELKAGVKEFQEEMKRRNKPM